MTTQIVTFGCRLNAWESEAMRRLAADRGDLVVFNTCAVTAEAERQARQAIRKARRERPEARIVVTGCAAQIAPERWLAMPEVDRVVGNREKLEAAAWAPEAPALMAGDIMSVRETAGHLLDGFGGRARAFVQVQQGCDHRCTFCIIPFGRGPNRSAPPDEVVAQTRRLLAAGAVEIVLTGVDIASWGADLPGAPRLGALVGRLLARLPELRRLRLSSLDPAAIDEQLFRLLAEEPRLMPHLHLSAQAGDDLILKRMKRRHLAGDVLSLCARLRAARPEIVFGADLIAGFPTESEAMFANSLDLVEAAPLTWLHVFPYSPRSGTPAARMPQLPVPVRRERARRLRQAGEAAAQRFLESRLGCEERVAVERAGFGRTEQFAPVRLEGMAPPEEASPEGPAGAVRRARVRGVEAGRLVAEALAA